MHLLDSFVLFWCWKKPTIVQVIIQIYQRFLTLLGWCKGQHINPIRPSPPQLANYLNERFEGGASASSICLFTVLDRRHNKNIVIGWVWPIFPPSYSPITFICTRTCQFLIIDTTVGLAFYAWFSMASSLWTYRTSFHSIFILENLFSYCRRRSEIQALSVLPHLQRFGKNYSDITLNTIPRSFQKIRIWRCRLVQLLSQRFRRLGPGTSKRHASVPYNLLDGISRR